MKLFEEPKLTCVKFDVEDVITGSFEESESPDEGGSGGQEDM